MVCVLGKSGSQSCERCWRRRACRTRGNAWCVAADAAPGGFQRAVHPPFTRRAYTIAPCGLFRSRPGPCHACTYVGVKEMLGREVTNRGGRTVSEIHRTRPKAGMV